MYLDTEQLTALCASVFVCSFHQLLMGEMRVVFLIYSKKQFALQADNISFISNLEVNYKTKL